MKRGVVAMAAFSSSVGFIENAPTWQLECGMTVGSTGIFAKVAFDGQQVCFHSRPCVSTISGNDCIKDALMLGQVALDAKIRPGEGAPRQ